MHVNNALLQNKFHGKIKSKLPTNYKFFQEISISLPMSDLDEILLKHYTFNNIKLQKMYN
jgi:hypothetical protein